MFASPFLLGFAFVAATLTQAVELSGYEYIVVGSGAGGGPLAVRLAMAGHKTLLIEAGDDQSGNVNTTVPAYNPLATEDDAIAWDFFVHHYADDARQARDFKTTYDTPDGQEYTGLNPPPGSKVRGTLYPRVGSLGGCTIHNAMIAMYPFQSDFNSIAQLTGDSSWSESNMRKYWQKIEDNNYLLPGLPGHGYSGWLSTQTAPLTLGIEDLQATSMLLGGAFALGNLTGGIFNLASLVAGDPNSILPSRDTKDNYHQVPLSTKDGVRAGSRDLILETFNARRADGTKRYPLDIRLDCHVTKVTFDNSTTPKATGVEFLDGKYLYRAATRSRNAAPGTPGSALASREVIIAGGTYNSPQILKLSGIGPAAELSRFNIPLLVDLPGVGTNLQDHYEVAIKGRIARNFSTAEDCTFSLNNRPDPCLARWSRPILGNRGAYASSGFAATMLHRSAQDTEWDNFIFGGPADFQGYYPKYSIDGATIKNSFTWIVLKAHPRNTAGTVELTSGDPLDVPRITYNYFDTGDQEGYEKDLKSMVEGVKLGRDALKRQPIPVEEVYPGDGVRTDEQIMQYIKDTAWGHHASSTCPIGADGDAMAVLDSSFRVRGVRGLRVVDASVYPKIPGTFTAVSTYMVAEKAADVILSQLQN